MTTAYVPQPGTIAARVIAHFEEHAAESELQAGVLADALGTDANMVNVCLSSAARAGLVVREKREGRVYWRLGKPARPPSPDPDLEDDSDEGAQPIARVIASAAAAPIPGLVRQSWCPAAQNSDSASSGAEPAPEPPPPSPPAPPLGLGWKAPSRVRVPVFERDASADNTSPAAGPEAAGALEAADPDFREVDRAQVPDAIHGTDAFGNPSNGLEAVSPGADGEFLCALWSNGEFEMQLTSGRLVRLTAADTRGLLRYVGDMLSARARAVA